MNSFIIILFTFYAIYIIVRICMEVVKGKGKQDAYEKESVHFFMDEALSKYSKASYRIRYGKILKCNTNRNEITIIEKDQYSVLDLYGCFHEIGHLLDNQNKIIRYLYKSIYLFGINRLIVMPLILINFLLCAIRNESFLPSYVYIPLIIFYFLVSLIRFISIPLLEIRANRIARKYFPIRKIVEKGKKEYKQIRIYGILCIVEQFILAICWTWIISFIVWIGFSVGWYGIIW